MSITQRILRLMAYKGLSQRQGRRLRQVRAYIKSLGFGLSLVLAVLACTTTSDQQGAEDNANANENANANDEGDEQGEQGDEQGEGSNNQAANNQATANGAGGSDDDADLFADLEGGQAAPNQVQDAGLPAAPAAPPPPPPPPSVAAAPLPAMPPPVAMVKPILWWLGLDYQEENAAVKVEVVTKGKPKYELLEQHNAAGQAELVVRLLDTQIRKKLLRPIDASEFPSPLSYIRAQVDPTGQHVDIVLTLREAVQPELFAHEGNLLLHFPIPEHYYGNSEIGDAPIGQAKALYKQGVLPALLLGSDLPNNHQASAMQAAGAAAQAATGQQAQAAMPGDDAGAAVDAPAEAPPAGDGLPPEGDTLMPNDGFEPGPGPGGDSAPSNQDADQQASRAGPFQAVLCAEAYGYELEASHYLASVAADEFGDDGFSDAEFMDDNELFGEDPAAAAPAARAPAAAQRGGATAAAPSNAAGTTAAGATAPPATSGTTQVDLSGEEAEGQEQAAPVKPSTFQPISLDFKDAPLREVVQAFTRENAVNFVFTNTVGDSKVHLALKNVPWDIALSALLDSHGLGMVHLKGNVIRIDKVSQLQAEKKQLEELQKAERKLIPTKVLVVRLSYAKAAEVVAVAQTMLKTGDERTAFSADERTNSVVVESIPGDLTKIKAIIERLDLPTPQVKIAARIVEVIKSVNKGLGINWASPLRADQSRGLGFGSLVFPNQVTSAFSVDTGMPQGTAGVSALDFHLGSINNLAELDLRLRMFETLNMTRTIQNNEVIVLDNQQATISAGTQETLSFFNRDNEAQTMQVDYLLKLVVKPHITAEGTVQMVVTVGNSAPSSTVREGVAASRTTRDLTTSLLRASGETAVIGGIHTTDSIEDQRGVPFLSSLPLIGALFRSKLNSDRRRDLLILLTPTIINADKPGDELTAGNAATNSPSNEQGMDNAMANGQIASNIPPAGGGNASQSPNSGEQGADNSNQSNNQSNDQSENQGNNSQSDSQNDQGNTQEE